jgi:hypothetical protein
LEQRQALAEGAKQNAVARDHSAAPPKGLRLLRDTG